jgi:hypothetical protein
MARKTINERMYRNAQGQPYLQVAMWHERPGVLSLSVYYFVGGKTLERVLYRRELYPFVEGGMTKAEFAQTVKTLALVCAMELGEPDPYITGNMPILKPPVISVTHKEKSNGQ